MTALAVVTFSVANPLAAYGVFLPVLTSTFGWSRGSVSLALSINLLLGGIVGFAVGAIADRWGPRGPLVVTVLLAGLGFALVSAVTALWHLHLVVGVMAGCGMSGFYVLATATAARWFRARRGLALAIVLIGFNVGYMTGGPLAAVLIAHVGWRAAYLVLGLGVCVVGGLASLVVRVPDPGRGSVAPGGARACGAPPAPAGSCMPTSDRSRGPRGTAAEGGMDLAQALQDPRLWLLTVSWFLFGAVLMMVTVHSVSYARDRGIAFEVAALTVTAYGVGAVAGRLGLGLVVDRFGDHAAMAWCFGIQVAALGLLLVVQSPAPLLVLVGVFGLGVIGADTVFAKAIPDLFGVKALGAIMGVLSLGWRAGAALGPAAAGFLHDLTGSYAVAFGVSPGLVALGVASFALASRRRRMR